MRTLRTHPVRALAALGLLSLLYLLFLPSAAGAGLSGDCPIDQNWAMIDGIQYTAANDTADNPVVLQAGATLQVEYLGTTTKEITDHSGQIEIEIGPAGIVVADWAAKNKPKPTLSKGGTYSLDVPDIVGIFDVSGFHKGTGGSCAGDAVVKIEGKSPLATPVGAGAAGGTLLAGIGLAVSAIAKKGVA